MVFDVTNFASGLVGALIGALASIAVSFLQFRWNRTENEKQRTHERELQSARERHEKDMQRREKNFQRSGMHDPSALGLGRNG